VPNGIKNMRFVVQKFAVSKSKINAKKTGRKTPFLAWNFCKILSL
jgi:hypothetical protein